MSKKQKDFFRGKDWTLKGRILFPKVFKAEVGEYSNKARFSVQFFWERGDEKNKEALKEMLTMMKAYQEEFHPGHKNFIIPIKDYDTYRKKDGNQAADYLEGCRWINPTSGEDFPPAVFDHQKKRMSENDASQFTNGRNALVNVSLFGYEVKGNTGCAINLRALILMPGGDPIGGATVNPDVLFKGLEEEIKEAESANVDVVMDSIQI